MRSANPLWNQLIQLTFKSQISLQAQIREMLVVAILDGQIPVGVALPSTRVLAQQLGVARNTVALAYELLVNEGYLQTRSRSGHFVNAEILAGHARARPRAIAPADAPPAIAWSPRLRSSVSRQRNIVKPADWQKYPYPFLYGQFDPAQMPVAGWRECSIQALSSVEVRAWAGDHIDADDALLIEQIQTRLLARRGVWAAPSTRCSCWRRCSSAPRPQSAWRIPDIPTRATSSRRAPRAWSSFPSTATGSRCRSRSMTANTSTSRRRTNVRPT
jgi:GntR family transcriptional regulator/MocR family aminotransferase